VKQVGVYPKNNNQENVSLQENTASQQVTRRKPVCWSAGVQTPVCVTFVSHRRKEALARAVVDGSQGQDKREGSQA
jgi:hypothetical protein